MAAAADRESAHLHRLAVLGCGGPVLCVSHCDVIRGVIARVRLAVIAIWAALVLAVVLSETMTAVLLLPVFTGLTPLMLRRNIPRALVLPVLGLLVLALALAPLILTLMNIDPVAEIFRATGKNATLTGRTEILGVALHVVGQSPVLGYGDGAFWLADPSAAARHIVLEAGATAPTFHNMALEILVGTGLAGFTAMVLLLGTSLRWALRWSWRQPRSVEAALSVVTILLPITVAMVEPFLYRQHEIQLIWIVAIGTSILYHSPSQIGRGPRFGGDKNGTPP